jgi:hypothetical protein
VGGHGVVVAVLHPHPLPLLPLRREKGARSGTGRRLATGGERLQRRLPSPCQPWQGEELPGAQGEGRRVRGVIAQAVRIIWHPYQSVG